MSERSDEKVKILLVDDRPSNLLALKSLLERPDYELVLAQSGDEALRALLRHDFAVILLDVAMPGMDGFETAALIKKRQRTREVPILFVTASVYDMQSIFQGYTVGAVDYLQKPIDPHQVRAKVAVFVALYRQARQIERQAAALRASAERERELLRRRAEDSEAQYRITVEEAPVGIGEADAEGKWRRANPRLTAILGLDAEALVGRPLVEAVDPSERAAVAEVLRRAVTGETVRHAGARFRRSDGEARLIDLTVAPVRAATPGDGVQRLLAVVDDVTEARRTSEALGAAEARFRRLSESGLIGIVFSTAEGQVTDANAAFLSMIGASGAELREGRINLRDLTPPGHEDADGRAREELASSGVFRTYGKEFLRRDGRRVAVLLGGARLPPPQEGDVSFVLDITERRAVEEERARLVRELREAVRARDDFLAVAAHELRTPLTPLRLHVQSLQRALDRSDPERTNPARLAARLSTVDASVRRLERLIDRLLDVSRLTVGRLRLELEDVDLASVVREVVERARAEADPAGSSIALRAEQAVVGRWDRLRLEQAATNLLSNAIKYGGGKPIEVEVGGDEERAWLVVRDHGIGIPPDEQARIFERFERLAPVRNFGGFGLGLWIVRQIIEAQGGVIEVDSRPGEGSCFTVRLPLRPATEAEAAEQTMH